MTTNLESVLVEEWEASAGCVRDVESGDWLFVEDGDLAEVRANVAVLGKRALAMVMKLERLNSVLCCMGRVNEKPHDPDCELAGLVEEAKKLG